MHFKKCKLDQLCGLRKEWQKVAESKCQDYYILFTLITLA